VGSRGSRLVDDPGLLFIQLPGRFGGREHLRRLLLKEALGAGHEGVDLLQKSHPLKLQVAKGRLQFQHPLVGVPDDLVGLEIGLPEQQRLFAVGGIQEILLGPLGVKQGLPEDAVLVLVLLQPLPEIQHLVPKLGVLVLDLCPHGSHLAEESAL